MRTRSFHWENLHGARGVVHCTLYINNSLMEQELGQPSGSRRLALIAGLLVIIFLGGVTFFIIKALESIQPGGPDTIVTEGVAPFASAEEFQSYLAQGQMQQTMYYRGGARALGEDFALPEAAPSDALAPGAPGKQRVSATNVQVAGIDEPDIVKTDGKEIYWSGSGGYYWDQPIPLSQPSVLPEEKLMPYPSLPRTKLIKAFPPDQMVHEGSILEQGNLLLVKDMLVVFSYNKISGYNIADLKNPKEAWKIDLASDTSLVTSRLHEGSIYLVSATQINRDDPCPLFPYTIGQKDIPIPCAKIYHPRAIVPVEVTYNISVLDPMTGDIGRSASFAAPSQGMSVVYMSPEALYITYPVMGDFIRVLHDFFATKASDLVPQSVMSRLTQLMNYDISAQSKFTELQITFERYLASLGPDERKRIENEITNRMSTYMQEHQRELQQSGIVKIDREAMTIAATGSVPGTPLNQFSLDEHEGYLRIATTVGASGGFFFPLGDTQSVSDVYVLDDDLKQVGSVKDLGKDERIYSVRFIGDQGYVVTFKQVDPFFVIDLANPKAPQVKGELKIPGYSSYLQPLREHLILGVGKEGSNVKLSLFDVSSAQNPTEKSKYTLNEYWSEALDNHHAFLLDSDNQIFFIPGSQGGYVFSYKNDTLSLQRAVTEVIPSRALFIDHYLYLVGNNKIVVLDENNWQKVSDLTLAPEIPTPPPYR